ncbi:MAG: hypothetical protein COB12_01175 [Flavobacterium sp.]|nr:MAG: hypothetical protein COB12_01175 [Flavobacterium sp.]
MGTKLYLIFEYLYLVMAALSVYVVATSWSNDRNRAYLFAFFAVVAVFMFFFKRNFRKKMNAQKQKD